MSHTFPRSLSRPPPIESTYQGWVKGSWPRCISLQKGIFGTLTFIVAVVSFKKRKVWKLIWITFGLLIQTAAIQGLGEEQTNIVKLPCIFVSWIFLVLPNSLLHFLLCFCELFVNYWWPFPTTSMGIYIFFPPIYFFISWRLITLQYCSGFCHTLTWISHGFTCIPHPDTPSHLPLHPIPPGLPSAPGPSACLMHPTWAGDLFHPR